METLIILAHPNLANSRINKMLIQSIENESNVKVRNLYQLYPDFKINAAEELKFLRACDKIIYQFPLYLYGSPALLKEYQDVIWTAASTGDNVVADLEIFAHKPFMIVASAGGPKESYQKDGRYRKSIDDIFLPFYLSAEYVKMEPKPSFCVYGAHHVSDEEINLAIQDYKNAINNL